MRLRPEQMCEARISYVNINQGSSRFVVDLEGRQHDLDPDTKELPAMEVVEIDCERCPIKGVVFTLEGEPPYGAKNAARQKAAEVLRDSCTKFPVVRDIVSYGGLPTRDFHSNL